MTQTRSDGPHAGIVLFRPDYAQLRPALETLEAGGERVHLFLNGPVSDEVEARLAGSPSFNLLRSPRNLGQAAGLNALADAAKREGARTLLLLDQDSDPPLKLAARLEQAWRSALARRLAAVGPLLVPPVGEGYRPLRYDWREAAGSGPGARLRAVEFLPTSGSLIDLAAFESIGPFREDFFIGGVDVEWGLRAWSLGYGSAVALDIETPHRWGSPVAPGGRAEPQILRQSPLRNYYYLRNAAYSMGLAHAPAGWRRRMALRMAAQIGLLLARGAPRAAQFRAIRRALGDGRAGRLGAAPADIA